jgi:ABC-type transport system substrate-binding protein
MRKFVRSFPLFLALLGLIGSVALADLPAEPLVVLDCADPPEGFTCADVKGGSYSFSNIASPSTLNPVTSEDTASLSIQDQFLGTFFTSYSLLADGTNPQVASTVEVNEEGTAVTYTLREGLLYSDGTPVTVDDITYWYYNVISNPNLPNSFTATVCTDGSPFRLEVLSDTQIRVSCPEPFRTFVGQAGAQFLVLSKEMALDLIEAQGIGTQQAISPGPDGVLDTAPEGDDEIAYAILAAGENGTLDSVPAGDDEVIEIATDEFMGLGAPLNLLRGLGPFVLTSLSSDALAKYERNPNFYEADSNGTQLPYLDEVQIIIIPTQGQELSLQNFLNGLTQVLGPRPQDISVILSRAAGGGFPVNEDIDTGQPNFGTTFTTPNFDDPDPNLAAAARNVTVRRALNLAIDRVALVQNVLLGLGSPQYVQGSTPSIFYVGRDNTCEDFIAAGLATAADCDGTTWTLPSGLTVDVTSLVPPATDYLVTLLGCLVDFDGCLAEAGAMLDSVGVTDTNGDGVREIPANLDPVIGNPGGDFVVQVLTNAGNTLRENYDLIVCDGWNAIGVKCSATTASFPQLVRELLTGTFTGYITIGLTGGTTPGGTNVVPCGTVLHFWHTSCDPGATEGPAAPLPDEQAIEDAWFEGFVAVTQEDAAVGFDKFQLLWAENPQFLLLSVTNGLFAKRTDQLCNDGGAINGNTDVKFRIDLPGQSACPE